MFSKLLNTASVVSASTLNVVKTKAAVVAGVAAVALGSGNVFAGADAATIPASLKVGGFLTNLMTENAPGIIIGAAVMVGLTILTYVKRGFGKKAGQAAGQ